jgi:hypothetical protein
MSLTCHRALDRVRGSAFIYLADQKVAGKYEFTGVVLRIDAG